MPYRFFRRVRIASGVSVNLSKRGTSLSLGGRGFHDTVGHGRRRTTVGVPGTGMYWTTYSHRHARAARRTVRRGGPSTVSMQPSVADLFHKPPLQKIGWGLAYCLFVITIPVGLPLLVTGLVQLPMPRWRQRSLIHRALAPGRSPEQASALLDRAGRVAGETAELVAARAEIAYRQERWPDAAALYDRYLAMAPGDWLARSHDAQACLEEGRYDDAIAHFQQALGEASAADEDTRVELARGLASAHMGRGDIPQALAILRAQPLRRHTLSGQLASCLYLRAVCEYLVGQRSRALADLDRLYAMAPGQLGDLQVVRKSMEDGSFVYEMGDRRLTARGGATPTA